MSSAPFRSRLDDAHDRPAYAVEAAVAGLPEEEPKADDRARAARERDDDRDPSAAAWTQAAENRLRSALAAIPTDPKALDETLGNPPGSHIVWVNIGRAINRLGWGERGFEIWHDWCARSPEYNLAGLLTNWRSFERTRLDEGGVTVRTIFHYAQQFGWKDEEPETVEPEIVEPTYPAMHTMPIEEARRALDQHIDWFIEDAVNPNWAIQFATEDAPLVEAIRASTGIGKTQRFAARLARRRPEKTCLYLVPTHRLGEDVAKLFEEQGLTARVYRGREAADPTIPGNLKRPKRERALMCLEPEKVALARACGQRIDTTCCKNKEQQCASFGLCGYQRQLRGAAPVVWLAAHNMLFHPLGIFKDVSVVVIDETFYSDGITGITPHGDDGDHVFTLEDLRDPNLNPWGILKEDFIQLLREQPIGGLERDRLIDSCSGLDYKAMITDEWRFINASVKISPNITAAQAAEVRELVPAVRMARFRIGIWHGLRELMEAPEGTISGRLILKENRKGKRVLRIRGVHEIVEARKLPTLILDATLPDVEVLRTWYPQVEVVADIEVQMPTSVHVRQVLKAPVSQNKLWGRGKKAVGRNRQAIRRYILQRWLETDRRSMLVICQKDVEEWLLKEAGLPEGISVEHFNAISGLDQYKGVRSLILIGRTIPSPTAVEDLAGALTGIQPAKVAATGNWYDRVTRGIRMADGTGIAVATDQHPDPMAEAVRWQICEAELMQALGRARAINRDAGTPLTVDILDDVVLPVAVDEVVVWEEPSPIIEAAVEGIVLTAPGDSAKAWPGIWPTARAAKWAFEAAAARAKDVFSIYRFYIEKTSRAILYTTASTKFRRASAFFDPAILPTPRAWLEGRLGALVSLLHLFRPGEVPPLAGEGGLAVPDDKVVTIRPLTEQIRPIVPQ
jgi:hypothetical protein